MLSKGSLSGETFSKKCHFIQKYSEFYYKLFQSNSELHQTLITASLHASIICFKKKKKRLGVVRVLTVTGFLVDTGSSGWCSARLGD